MTLELVVDNAPAPTSPPAGVTPEVALIAALKQRPRRAVVLIEDQDGLIQARWSDMPRAVALELAALGLRLLHHGLPD